MLYGKTTPEQKSAKKLKVKASKHTSSYRFDLLCQGELEDYITALAWSPRKDFLAIASASGKIHLWSTAHQHTLASAGSGRSINALSFSADGRYLAAAGQQGSVLIWQMDAIAQPPIMLEKSTAWIDCLAWHPSEPQLAFGTGQQAKVWNIEQKEQVTAQSFSASSVLSLAWHPTGKHLAASGHTGVKVWQADNWTAEPEFVEVPGASLSLAWSADGLYLASGNLDRTLTVVAWESPPPWLMQGFPGKVRQVVWPANTVDNSTQHTVAAACANGVTVWRRQGKVWKSTVLEGHRGIVQAIAFHPTQPLLASAAEDGRLCLWQNAKSLSQTLSGTRGGFSVIAWHPTGNYLAAGSTQGEWFIWQPSNRGLGFQ